MKDKEERTDTTAMDIRSIIDSEDTPPTRRPSLAAGVKQEYQPSPVGYSASQAAIHDNRRDVRPPQPLPLQTPAHNEPYFPASSSQDSAQSPYQRRSSFGLSNGQYHIQQAPQHSPPYGPQVLQYPQRENSLPSGPQSGRSFGHSTPLSQTPTASTPGSASIYSNFPRPTSSHSIPTPNSAHHSFNHTKESPHASLSQARSFSQTQAGQHYLSQPATPLGPPTIYGRPSLNAHRASPEEHRQHRSPSSGFHSQHEFVGPPTVNSRSPPSSREQSSNVQAYSNLYKREQSLSVSPKTKIQSLPSNDRRDSLEGRLETQGGRNGYHTTQQFNEPDSSDTSYTSTLKSSRKQSQSIGVSGLLNEEPPMKSPESVYPAPHKKISLGNQSESDIQFLGSNMSGQSLQSQSPPPHYHPSDQAYATSLQQPVLQNQASTANVVGHRTSDLAPQLLPKSEPVSSFKMAALKGSSSLIDAPLPSVKKASGSRKPKRPIQESLETDVSDNKTVTPQQPVNKKARVEGPPKSSSPAAPQKVEPPPPRKKPKVPRITRWQDIPVFAQSILGPQRTMELFQQSMNGTNRSNSTATPTPKPSANAGSRPPNHTAGPAKPPAQAPNQSFVPNGLSALPNQPLAGNFGPLGPWEYNVTDTEPADELIKNVADFIFPLVVTKDDVGVAPAGGGRGLGAVLEIEAKIGKLIDRNTNDRLRLPVLNECMVSHADPNLRIAFESSMTEVSLAQHIWPRNQSLT